VLGPWKQLAGPLRILSDDRLREVHGFCNVVVPRQAGASASASPRRQVFLLNHEVHRFAWAFVIGAIFFGFNALANEKPTPEFQALMKANAAAAGPTGLRGHVPAKDYDAIVKDAAVLKANYVKIEAFWTQKKVDDAIKFSKDGGMAAGDLEAAAKAKDDAGITAAMGKVTATCSGCHTAHREQLPDKTYEIK